MNGATTLVWVEVTRWLSLRLAEWPDGTTAVHLRRAAIRMMVTTMLGRHRFVAIIDGV